MIDVNTAVIMIEGMEKNECEDIQRCLNTLYSIRMGEQPLDREFGLDQTFLDQPIHIGKNMLALEIMEKTQRYEKRVIVDKVEFETGEEGNLTPVIYLKRS